MNRYGKLKTLWLSLVKAGVNAPTHENHYAIYLPLATWLDNNKHKEKEDDDTRH